ncbi:metastasis-associated protein MTA3-like [Sycon ciliatum]|uniref:metastasis-associated protein MTA3-like n=1 Tax=Sycon ciliatum TaxID=27933 RepID=UPI0020A8AB8D|eukprot:scpid34929/ scgid14320/ Metastasis-associated protein MTA3
MASYAMCEGLYRVGDFVFMEVNSNKEPYYICRLDSISKSSSGTVEATVSRYMRMRDMNTTLKLTAAKHLEDVEEDSPNNGFFPSKLSTDQQHQLSHRHLFLTRDNDTFEVSLIRGRCEVTLLCEEESPDYYLKENHKFFYSLVYDSQQRTLVEESGEIRTGPKYQAEIPDMLPPGQEDENEPACAAATQVWCPDNLTSQQVDQFMVLARSVGTFARAMISSRNQPSLCVSAAAASRDVTLFHAMSTLHRYRYNLSQAVCALVPQGGPLLCRDELENWTPDEVAQFEQSLVKYGKDFFDIQKNSLVWKSVKSLVEYYYMWKTTERYLRVKQQKHNEKNGNSLKQIRISISKNQPGGANGASTPRTVGQASNGNGAQLATAASRHPEIEGRCEGCPATSSVRWHKWNHGGDTNAQPLCSPCWEYWMRYGGLKRPTIHEASQPENRGEHKCNVCGKTFSRKERLTAHQRDQHLPYPCGLKGCNKSFKSKAGAQRHMITMHGIGEEGVKNDNAPSKPFHLRPFATAIAARRSIPAIALRHSARKPSAAIPRDNLVLQNGAFYPGVGRQKMWWKVKGRKPINDMIEVLVNMPSSARYRTVRSPTIAPNYSTHRGSQSSVRARTAAIRMARPGGESPRLLPAKSNGDTAPSSAATVAAYMAARQGEEVPRQGAAGVDVVDLTSGEAAAPPKGIKRAADENGDSAAPRAKSPRLA